MSGWSRNTMDGTPFCSGSQSLQTRRVKSGQTVVLLHLYTLCSAVSRQNGSGKKGIIAVRNMTMRRRQTEAGEGLDDSLCYHIGNHCGSLVLRISGRAFSA